MFGDYTIEQAAIVLDMSDEVVEETVRRRGIPTHRKFLLFGPVLLDKSFIDSIAPDVRALMQRSGGTRKDWERKKQEASQREEEIEQTKADIERIEEQRKKDQEDFLRQFNELTEEKRRRILAQLELDKK